jgi:hypothetical protein
MLRRLLNTAPIVCLIACLALMGMWVRSYYWSDELLARMTGRDIVIFTLEGRLVAYRYAINSHGFDNLKSSWLWIGGPRSADSPGFSKRLIDSLGFLWVQEGVMLPYWLLVLTCCFLAMILRMRWPPRFTLRSLFIATTFLAVVLGMIAWLDRAWIGR